MALEDIFRALEEQADKDIEAVLAEARDHARVIHDDAVREAEQARESRVSEAEEAARQRSMQALNGVRLEVRKQVASAKERAVASVFAEARSALLRIRERDDYPTVFSALVAEALEGAPEGVELLVDPADTELARSTVARIGAQVSIAPDLESAGGVVVAIDGRRILRRNTLENRLDKFEGVSQADVAEILFA